jgi:hypothetical protein
MNFYMVKFNPKSVIEIRESLIAVQRIFYQGRIFQNGIRNIVVQLEKH